MLSTGPNYSKLKTNLRLAISRLKLLEKKKTELAQKARREIADYLANGKTERAKIRVEHIIREDYMVEAMELLEMYCDLLLARFGLIQQMSTVDDGLAEAISSLIWAGPRVQTDVAEMKVIVDQLTAKYGKPYAKAARENSLEAVNPKLVHKLSVQAPPKVLVEKYLIEIAKSHNVEYEPDQQILNEEEDLVNPKANLIDLMPTNLPPPPVTSPFVFPRPEPIIPSSSEGPPPLPSVPPSGPYAGVASPPPIGFMNFDGPSLPNFPSDLKPPSDASMPSENSFVPPPSIPPGLAPGQPPVPAPRSKFPTDSLPELPSVPDTSLHLDGSINHNEKPVDFDDLTKRFEELKKKK